VQQIELGPVPVIHGKELANLPRQPSQIWSRVPPQAVGLGDWNHESQVASHCQAVLDDIISLSGLSITTSLEGKLDLAHRFRADILLFKVHGQIIGACEVKKSSRKNSGEALQTNDLNNDNFDIQMSNYLQVIRHIHGVLQPIVI
jgi:hypothetical protein